MRVSFSFMYPARGVTRTHLKGDGVGNTIGVDVVTNTTAGYRTQAFQPVAK